MPCDPGHRVECSRVDSPLVLEPADQASWGGGCGQVGGQRVGHHVCSSLLTKWQWQPGQTSAAAIAAAAAAAMRVPLLLCAAAAVALGCLPRCLAQHGCCC